MPLSYLVTSAAPPVTADQCWALHRQVLGGVSSVTGAPLPESITACPAGAQKAHFAFAVLVNLAAGREMPAPPPGLDDAETGKGEGRGDHQDSSRPSASRSAFGYMAVIAATRLRSTLSRALARSVNSCSYA